jgi:hypothetical protein
MGGLGSGIPGRRVPAFSIEGKVVDSRSRFRRMGDDDRGMRCLLDEAEPCGLDVLAICAVAREYESGDGGATDPFLLPAR